MLVWAGTLQIKGHRLQSQYQLSYLRGVPDSTQWGKPGKRGSCQGHDSGDPQVRGPLANTTTSSPSDRSVRSSSGGYAGLADEVDLRTAVGGVLKGVALAAVLGVGGELAFGSSDSDLVSVSARAGGTAMREDLLTEPADEIACNSGYRLQEVGGRGETFAATAAKSAITGGSRRTARSPTRGDAWMTRYGGLSATIGTTINTAAMTMPGEFAPSQLCRRIMLRPEPLRAL